MSEAVESPVSRPKVKRRRRANVEGKAHYVRVTLSEAERVALYVKESETGRSPSEILVSAALSPAGSESSVDRQALMYELAMIRRYLLALSNNTNQLAKHANVTGEFPASAATVVSRTRTVAERVNALVEKLMD